MEATAAELEKPKLAKKREVPVHQVNTNFPHFSFLKQRNIDAGQIVEAPQLAHGGGLNAANIGRNVRLSWLVLHPGSVKR